METFVSFTNRSQGRDRIFRATQYACALARHLLRDRALRETLQQLETNMSAGRKLLRLGNTVSSVQAARSTLSLPDPVLRLCLTAANLSRALYFLCDNLLWARSVGLIRHISRERWSLHASRFYFLSLLMNLARDLYAILQLAAHRSRDLRHQQKEARLLEESPEVACVIVPQLDALLFLLYESLKSRPALALDTLRNACDLFIPLDRLGVYRTNAGVVGFCGLVSSILGILALLRPTLQIKP